MEGIHFSNTLLAYKWDGRKPKDYKSIQAGLLFSELLMRRGMRRSEYLARVKGTMSAALLLRTLRITRAQEPF